LNLTPNSVSSLFLISSITSGKGECIIISVPEYLSVAFGVVE
jgi:hypothetical protein